MTGEDALDIVDAAHARAANEVGRLTRKVRINAEQPVNAGRVTPALYSTAVEDQIALHTARAALAALNGVWADIARALQKEVR